MSNPGVGLKLTTPRIPAGSCSDKSPGPQTYSIGGTMEQTSREKSQNLLLSKRYEGKNFSASSSPAGSATMQAQKHNVGDAQNSHATQSSSDSSSAPPSAGKKRARDQDGAAPTEYYNIPGMSDLTAGEVNQNELLSKRYQKKD